MSSPLWRLAVLASFWAGTAVAGDHLTLSIGATVLPRASAQLADAPATMTITSADVARGWIDVETPLNLSVRSNTARGALLVFSTTSDFVEQTQVRGLSEPFQMGATGGAALLPAARAGRGPEALALRFRFYLARSTPPGVHAWPLRIAAQPA